ncbi:hypothetical protein ACFP81_10535 [Deinococcus lacus]|uniref:Uncharacterized protein n=1 Tax=Deinococcus lacus TaxID=392561 RepID=A0ABW1YHP2_9DEIO
MTKNDQPYSNDTIALDLQLLALNDQQPCLVEQGAQVAPTGLLALIFEYREIAEQRGAAKAKGRSYLALSLTLNEMELQIGEGLEALAQAQDKGE